LKTLKIELQDDEEEEEIKEEIPIEEAKET